MPYLSSSTSRINARSLTLLGLLATLLLLGSCGGNGVSFTFTEESGEQVIEGGGIGTVIELPFDPFTFNVNLEQELEKRNAGPAKAVYLEGLEFQITDTKEKDGEKDDFGFMKSMTLRANADGEDKKRIAWKDSIPAKRSFKFNTDSEVDLKPYIEKGMKLSADAEGTKPDSDTSMKAIITLRVRTL